MLKTITDEKAVRRCQRLLLDSLKNGKRELIKVSLGHQGASIKAKVNYRPDIDLWFISRKSADGRVWNAFGCGRPPAGTARKITCEINFPAGCQDGKTGGIVAEDGRGDVYLLHRGRIGGGKKGIGLNFFRRFFRGVWTTVNDGDTLVPALVVGRFKSSLLARQVALFVTKVELLKRNLPGQARMALELEETAFSLDRVGMALQEQAATLDSRCERELAIIDLARQLQVGGCKTGNQGQHDLLIRSANGKTTHLFAVAPDIGEASLQEATGRLLWDCPSSADGPRKCLVLPGAPAREARIKLETLGIRTVTFSWQDGAAVFDFTDAGLLRTPVQGDWKS